MYASKRSNTYASCLQGKLVMQWLPVAYLACKTTQDIHLNVEQLNA